MENKPISKRLHTRRSEFQIHITAALEYTKSAVFLVSIFIRFQRIEGKMQIISSFDLVECFNKLLY